MFEMIPFRINNLTRRDDFFSPFLKNFYDDDFFTATGNLQRSFKVDLKKTDENYFVEAELPGIKKEAIDIDFDNNYLVINTKKDEASEGKKENYVRRERHYGEFKPSFYIDNVNENKIDGSFSDGVLRITPPKLTKVREKIRKIDIR